MRELPSTSVPGGPRFQRRITDEPSLFAKTITGRWRLKMILYDPKRDGPAVELCQCKSCRTGRLGPLWAPNEVDHE